MVIGDFQLAAEVTSELGPKVTRWPIQMLTRASNDLLVQVVDRTESASLARGVDVGCPAAATARYSRAQGQIYFVGTLDHRKPGGRWPVAALAGPQLLGDRDEFVAIALQLHRADPADR